MSDRVFRRLLAGQGSYVGKSGHIAVNVNDQQDGAEIFMKVDDAGESIEIMLHPSEAESVARKLQWAVKKKAAFDAEMHGERRDDDE